MLFRSIVDAIYGTGFRGSIAEKAGRVIEALNGSGRPILAVDIPSGLEADTGRINGACIRADYTVTFGLPKLGLILEPGAFSFKASCPCDESPITGTVSHGF